jgi:hypothetical protein
VVSFGTLPASRFFDRRTDGSGERGRALVERARCGRFLSLSGALNLPLATERVEIIHGPSWQSHATAGGSIKKYFMIPRDATLRPENGQSDEGAQTCLKA